MTVGVFAFDEYAGYLLDEKKRLTSRQRSSSGSGKTKHHASVDNTRMMRKLNDQSRFSHNALRAGTSRALQVRARETVLFALMARRWVAMHVASSSSLKTWAAMVVTLQRGRETGIHSEMMGEAGLTKFGWRFMSLFPGQACRLEAVCAYGVKSRRTFRLPRLTFSI